MYGLGNSMDERIRLEIKQHLDDLHDMLPEIKLAAENPHDQKLRQNVIIFFEKALQVYQLVDRAGFPSHSTIMTLMNTIKTATDRGKNIADLFRIVDVNTTGMGRIPDSKNIIRRLFLEEMDIEIFAKNFVESMQHRMNRY